MLDKPDTLHLQMWLRMRAQSIVADHAFLYGTLARIWNILAGPVTMLLIAWRFSPELQGFYYTFNSLLALTVFLELGLGTVIQQFTSHEWAYLHLNKHGRIEGEPDAHSRLSNLVQIAFRWYGVAGLIAAIGIGVAGYIFFSQNRSSGVNWIAPWFTLCFFSGANLFLVPAWSILDGSNQMNKTNAARLLMAIVSNLSVWIAIMLEAKLWTTVVLSGIGLLTAFLFFWYCYRNYFFSILKPIYGPHISWRGEVWPMQWKIALSWLSGYFIFSMFTPMMFHFHGPVVAGQMGMTLSLASAILSVALTCVNTKTPEFCILISRGEYTALDRLFYQSTLLAMTIGALASLLAWILLYGLNLFHYSLAQRFLQPIPAGLLMCATLMNVFIATMAIYLRAHKREPYLLISVLNGVLVGFSTVLIGSHFGPTGAMSGYLAITLLMSFPAVVVFRQCRLKWHN